MASTQNTYSLEYNFVFVRVENCWLLTAPPKIKVFSLLFLLLLDVCVLHFEKKVFVRPRVHFFTVSVLLKMCLTFWKTKIVATFWIVWIAKGCSQQASKQIIVDETCFPTRTIATKWKRDPLTNSRRRTLVALLCVVYHYHHFSFQSLLMLPPGCWLAWQQCKSRHFLFSYLNGWAQQDMTWRWE